jgi:hypothetical protein
MAPRLFVDARQKPKMRSRGEDFALVIRATGCATNHGPDNIAK